MQEEIEQRSIAITVQAAKLSGRVLRSAIAAALRKMAEHRNTPTVGRNSMKKLTAKEPSAETIEVPGRIRSFERYARQNKVRYHVEKNTGTSPPTWTVYFKAGQASALTAAFQKYAKKELEKKEKPSLLTNLRKFKELAKTMGRDTVRNKQRGGPER